MTKKLSSYQKILKNHQENLKMAKNKLPSNVKKLRGTFRANRERKNEHLTRVPRKPTGMSAGGSKYWSILINRLSLIGSIDVVDDIAISILCESLAEYEEMTHFLNENGRVYTFTNAKNETSVRARPEIKIQNDLWTRIFQLFKEFGLTHKSRANIIPNPLEQTPNPFANLHRGANEK